GPARADQVLTAQALTRPARAGLVRRFGARPPIWPGGSSGAAQAKASRATAPCRRSAPGSGADEPRLSPRLHTRSPLTSHALFPPLHIPCADFTHAAAHVKYPNHM